MEVICVLGVLLCYFTINTCVVLYLKNTGPQNKKNSFGLFKNKVCHMQEPSTY